MRRVNWRFDMLLRAGFCAGVSVSKLCSRISEKNLLQSAVCRLINFPQGDQRNLYRAADMAPKRKVTRKLCVLLSRFGFLFCSKAPYSLRGIGASFFTLLGCEFIATCFRSNMIQGHVQEGWGRNLGRTTRVSACGISLPSNWSNKSDHSEGDL